MATVWDLAFVCAERAEAVFVSKRKWKCLLNAPDMALPIFKEYVHKEKRIYLTLSLKNTLHVSHYCCTELMSPEEPIENAQFLVVVDT